MLGISKNDTILSDDNERFTSDCLDGTLIIEYLDEIYDTHVNVKYIKEYFSMKIKN